MRCKPGDLAVIVKSVYPQWLGKLVHVRFRAPLDGKKFDLPNGVSSTCAVGVFWVTESAGGKFGPPLLGDQMWLTCNDACLRPIRPESDPEAIHVGEATDISDWGFVAARGEA